MRAANGAMMLALADGVAAGALDQAKLDAALAAVTAAAGSVHGASADALNALHNALTPEQRQALVDKIDAHWSIWKDSNAGDQATDNARPEGHIARLAQEIGLTNEQVDKTRAALAALPPASRGPFDPAAAEAHVKAFSAAFVAPQFDADADHGRPCEQGHRQLGRDSDGAFLPGVDARPDPRAASQGRRYTP